jgi:hypothetical protein
MINQKLIGIGLTNKFKRRKIMTEKQFMKKCREIAEDCRADGVEINASMAYDLAEGLLLTDPELKKYVQKQVGNKEIYQKEYLADSIF